MISEKNNGRSFGIFLGTTYATLITAMVGSFWSGTRIALIVIMFIALWIGFYFAGIWTMVERPAELNRKFPISSKELRRRKKAFYDWHASQGRH
jgi:disulfide bond formation protein DsbB